MNSKRLQPIEILLVEDSPTDVLLAQAALEDSNFLSRLHTVSDGVEAMAFLRREGQYGNAVRPNLVLLDLNLPRKDGREVLAEVKSDDLLKSIPVIVLTTSKSEVDVQKAYGLHANCYIVKPVDFEKFTSVMKYIENFWFSMVTLPGRD